MHGRGAVENLLGKTVIGVLAGLCAAHGVSAMQRTPVEVAPGVYALSGNGGEITPENGGRTANVAFVVGPDGVVVVDTGISYREGEEIIAAVKRISNRPIRLAILTHPSQEAIFGAAAFQARGIPVLAHRLGAELIAARCETCLRNLRTALGEEAMAATRVVKPDRLIEGDERLALIGRPLRLIAPKWSSAPGAIAVFDEQTSTLISGNLVLVNRVPNLRDADPKAWRDTLVQLASMRCRYLVPAFGPIGDCADIAAFAHYLAALEDCVEALVKDRGEPGRVAGSVQSSGICELGSVRNAASAKRHLRLPSPRTIAVRVSECNRNQKVSANSPFSVAILINCAGVCAPSFCRMLDWWLATVL